jgi:hypothetical protein
MGPNTPGSGNGPAEQTVFREHVIADGKPETLAQTQQTVIEKTQGDPAPASGEGEPNA